MVRVQFQKELEALHEPLPSLGRAASPRAPYFPHRRARRSRSVKAQPRVLLAKVPGLTLAEMNEAESCCGFGGTFSIKFGEISARMSDNKCQNIEDTQADAVVLGDLGCMLNIEGRLRRRGNEKTKVLHVAQVLAGDVD